MPRVIEIWSYYDDPPTLVARVELDDDDNACEIVYALNDTVRDDLTNHVLGGTAHKPWPVRLDRGEEYMNAVLVEYSGAFIRAVEVKP